MRFQIRNLQSRDVQVEVEIDDAFQAAPSSVQLGKAVEAALAKQADLDGANLIRADLRGATKGARLGNVYLPGANLSGALLSGADLRGANLINANLNRAELLGADMTKADLRFAHAPNAKLEGACFAGGRLLGINCAGADLRNATLDGAELRAVNFAEAVLVSSKLRKADLTNANLESAQLRDACLVDAVLVGANLSDAQLMGADLTGAKLAGANLSGVNLTNAVLTDVDLFCSDSYLRASCPLPHGLAVRSLHGKILTSIEMNQRVPHPGELSPNAGRRTTLGYAGWTVHHAGTAGRALRVAIGELAAAAFIITASCPYKHGKVPDFYLDEADMLATIRRDADHESE